MGSTHAVRGGAREGKEAARVKETAARPRKGRHVGQTAGRRYWREDCSEGE